MAAKYNYEKLRVLVIDDDSFTRNLICQMLREIGVRSIGVQANGKDGLMELVRTRPNIVLCDVHMEPMNGLQFIAGVRNIKVKGVDRTPVVFLTADANADTVVYAKEHGVAGYLVKPISRKLLNERIDTILAADPSLGGTMLW